jgi:hypothetical protein
LFKYENKQCSTFSHINENGEKVYKPKKQFETDKEAITEAKRLNSLPQTIHKVVAYKCKTCFKWHVGRTFKVIDKNI